MNGIPMVTAGPPSSDYEGPGSSAHHKLWWYPRRCEYPGCSARGTDLQKCSACGMVMYCGKEHQRADWSAHKPECATFRRLGLKALFYNDEEMLEKHPLGGAPATFGMDESHCGICHKDKRQEALTYTKCCDQLVCDTNHRYQMGSYSRAFCQRSHERYTLCGHHGVEPGCDKRKDWRQCPQCAHAKPRERPDDVADRLWRGLNAYNFYPLLERDVPRHALTDTCEKCRQRFMPGVEGSARVGFRLVCLPCSGVPQQGGAAPARSGGLGWDW